MNKRTDVIIVGGGIMGLSSAYYLQEAGYSVHIIDSGDGTDGCSYGNAGFVSPSHFIPLAAPGIIAQGIRWMTSPESPFYIKPRASINLAKWGLQFARHANEKHVNNSIKLLSDYTVLSRQLHQEIADEHKVDLHSNGIVMLCNTEKTFNHEIEIANMAHELGLEANVITMEQLKVLDPGINTAGVGAVHFPYDAYEEPSQFMDVMTKVLKAKGVTFSYNTEVTDFVISNGHIKAVCTSTDQFEADEVVVTTGSFTPPLLKKLGLNLLMEAGKGYSVDWTTPETIPALSYILVEARVAVTPMNSKVRFAGTMELGGINLDINRKRVRGFLKSIEAYLPDATYDKLKDIKPWAGLRPCSPDGLPFVGRYNKFKNLTVATGHAMLGFTLGPATGKLVTEIVQHKPTSIPIEKLSLSRF